MEEKIGEFSVVDKMLTVTGRMSLRQIDRSRCMDSDWKSTAANSKQPKCRNEKTISQGGSKGLTATTVGDALKRGTVEHSRCLVHQDGDLKLIRSRTHSQ